MTERSVGMAIRSTSLLACPFCGDDEPMEGEPDETAIGLLYNVHCRVCTCMLDGFTSQRAANRAWNKRPANNSITDIDAAERQNTKGD